jgi:hypothetical protein
MRGALERKMDVMMSMLALLQHVPKSTHQSLFDHLFRYESDEPGVRPEDRGTLFGLMQRITAAARDQGDPETRWRLEELGGGVPVTFTAPRRPIPPLAARVRRPLTIA